MKGEDEDVHDASIASQDHVLDTEIFQMTFLTEALQEVEIEGDSEAAPPLAPLTQSDQVIFERLWQIDDAYRLHAKFVEGHIDAMDKAVENCDSNGLCAAKSSLLGDQHSLKEQLESLCAIDTLGDKAHEVWKMALQKSIEHLLGRLGDSGYADFSRACEAKDPEMNFVDTSTSFLF